MAKILPDVTFFSCSEIFDSFQFPGNSLFDCLNNSKGRVKSENKARVKSERTYEKCAVLA